MSENLNPDPDLEVTPAPEADDPGEPGEVCRLRPITPPPASMIACRPNTERKQCADSYRDSEADRACSRDLEPVKNRNNGEENDLTDNSNAPTYAGNFTKGMHHNPLGEVEPRSDYERLLTAVNTQEPDAFEAIPTAFSTAPNATPQGRRYVDPQAGIAYDLEGPDAPSAGVYQPNLTWRYIRQAPRFDEPEFAAEMAEVYLMALLRDKPVNRFHRDTTDPNIQAAADNLSQYASYRGPKVNDTSQVTPQLLFRGGNVTTFRLTTGSPPPPSDGRETGETVGPLVSQFLLIGSRVDEGQGLADQFSASRIILPHTSVGLALRRDQGLVTYGTVTIDQRQHEVRRGIDFMQDYDEWLLIQKGARPSRKNEFTGRRRFLYSLRQLAHYVHFDQTYQEYLIAALLILSMQERANRIGQSIFDPGSPYDPSRTKNQEGFATFGNGHVLALLAEATTRALKAAWNGKWFNQRRLRPETAAGRIHNTEVGAVARERYGITGELLDTTHGQQLLERVRDFNQQAGADTYLLPQAYPEGSPLHPSYPAGHAAQAGACVTILKALFNESFAITDPSPSGDPDPDEDYAYEPNANGTALRIYQGPDSDQPLLLGQELNKLAANVSLARNMAGVHYRIDYAESVQLGEYVALGLLQEQARSFNPEHSLRLRLFNGTQVQIGATGQLSPTVVAIPLPDDEVDEGVRGMEAPSDQGISLLTT